MHSIPLGLCLDLDGTLVDSRSDIAAACNHALQALGRSPLPEAIVAGFVGDGARKLLSRALRTDQEPLLGEALLLFEAFYAAHPADHTTLLPGARELLERSPVPLALVTNKPRLATEQVLEALGIRGFFRDIAAGGDAPLKPRPDLVQRALGGLGLEASNTWMVGDGPQDMGAGRAAGCFTVAVLGGLASPESVRAEEPDITCDDLHEVLVRLRAARGEARKQ